VKISITGHQSLESSEAWGWVRAELDNLLMRLPRPLIGVTSLAIGADSLFAELVLQHHGSIEAVLPFSEYELKFEIHDRARYQRLLDMASAVIVLQRKQSDEESYFEAGKRVVDLADLLVAVWDGKPSKGLGGTADVVGYAVQRQKEIMHLNPVRRMVMKSRLSF